MIYYTAVGRFSIVVYTNCWTGVMALLHKVRVFLHHQADTVAWSVKLCKML